MFPKISPGCNAILIFLLSCFRKGICRTAWKRAIMTTDLLPRKGLSVKEIRFAEVH